MRARTFSFFAQIPSIEDRRNDRINSSNARVLLRRAGDAGGASGVGFQIASRCAALGARVVLWDLNEAALQQCAQQIAASGGTVWVYAVDVTDKSVRRELISFVLYF